MSREEGRTQRWVGQPTDFHDEQQQRRGRPQSPTRSPPYPDTDPSTRQHHYNRYPPGDYEEQEGAGEEEEEEDEEAEYQRYQQQRQERLRLSVSPPSRLSPSPHDQNASRGNRRPQSSGAGSRPRQGRGGGLRSHRGGSGNNGMVNGRGGGMTTAAAVAAPTSMGGPSPRFLHRGELLTFKGNIFDKLNDPSLFTGTSRFRFDEQGRGRGIFGKDSRSLAAQPTPLLKDQYDAESAQVVLGEKGARRMNPLSSPFLGVGGSTTYGNDRKGELWQRGLRCELHEPKAAALLNELEYQKYKSMVAKSLDYSVPWAWSQERIHLHANNAGAGSAGRSPSRRGGSPFRVSVAPTTELRPPPAYSNGEAADDYGNGDDHGGDGGVQRIEEDEYRRREQMQRLGRGAHLGPWSQRTTSSYGGVHGHDGRTASGSPGMRLTEEQQQMQRRGQQQERQWDRFFHPPEPPGTLLMEGYRLVPPSVSRSHGGTHNGGNGGGGASGAPAQPARRATEEGEWELQRDDETTRRYMGDGYVPMQQQVHRDRQQQQREEMEQRAQEAMKEVPLGELPWAQQATPRNGQQQQPDATIYHEEYHHGGGSRVPRKEMSPQRQWMEDHPIQPIVDAQGRPLVNIVNGEGGSNGVSVQQLEKERTDEVLRGSRGVRPWEAQLLSNGYTRGGGAAAEDPSVSTPTRPVWGEQEWQRQHTQSNVLPPNGGKTVPKSSYDADSTVATSYDAGTSSSPPRRPVVRSNEILPWKMRPDDMTTEPYIVPPHVAPLPTPSSTSASLKYHEPITSAVPFVNQGLYKGPIRPLDGTGNISNLLQSNTYELDRYAERVGDGRDRPAANGRGGFIADDGAAGFTGPGARVPTAVLPQSAVFPSNEARRLKGTTTVGDVMGPMNTKGAAPPSKWTRTGGGRMVPTVDDVVRFVDANAGVKNDDCPW